MKIIAYIIIAILVIGLLLFTLFTGQLTAWKDSGKEADKKCKTPDGKTDAEWREHMSHHPSIYKECLT